jgi:hypothetical protein
VSDTNGAGQHGTGGLDLRTTVAELLPTPTSRDGKGANQRGDETCLPGALLPTPRAARGASGTETMYKLGAERSDTNRPQGEVLLPTPSVADGMGGHLTRSGDRSDELLLPGVAREIALLPTPTVMDYKASGGSSPSDVTLTDAVVRTRLGESTNPRFDDGSDSPDQLPPRPS